MSAVGFVRVNFILPKNLYQALKALVPERKRSKLVTNLIQKELKRVENNLYKVARAVEKDKKLHQEMQIWDVTLNDGLDDHEFQVLERNTLR
ncbi:MAG: hypothetical protein HYS08_06820 [Chlamydiae bacterium]|nr:hypothetical protein [Chlamydiota bacterium]MBI3265543.1 hypothetical protein [Chlamydiota bacterium]